MNKTFYPLLFEPILKDYIWGGRTFEQLGRALPDEGVIAESWEIAGHDDGTTRVVNGCYAGKLLTDLHAELGLDLIGTNSAWAQARGKFPLLIKLLDANKQLSVQVHPTDDYALANEGNELGKTEMWVVLAAKPDAKLQVGVKANTTAAAFRAGIENGRLEPYLHYIPVQTGDHVCVPAGTLHAIMDGILIAEIQQNSNTTYRVYDWNRLGHDGQPRPLHIDKALDVINFDQVEPTICPPTLISDENGIRRERLCQNEYFITERLTLQAGATINGNCNGATFEIWGVLNGEIVINDLELAAVQFTLLPAKLGDFSVTAVTDSTLLRTYVD